MTDRPAPTEPGVYLSVWREPNTHAIQVELGELDSTGAGTGVRLLGPKFVGMSTLVTRRRLTSGDAKRIRRYLRRVADHA